MATLVGVTLATGCAGVSRGGSDGLVASSDDGSASGSGGGVGVDAASSCHASDVSTFMVASYRSANAPSAACLDADGGPLWDAFFDACLGTGKTPGSCNQFKASPTNAACAACILTPYTANRLGPIIDYGQFVGGNLAGCIEVTAPRELPCAKAFQVQTDCELAACQANCPVTDPRSLMDRENCKTTADATVCNSFSKVATSCRASESDAGVGSACMSGAFKDFYDQVVPIFCGRVPADASVVFDASTVDGSLVFEGDAGASADGGARDAVAE